MKIDQSCHAAVQRQKEIVALKMHQDEHLLAVLHKKFERLGFKDATALSQSVQLEKEQMILVNVAKRCLEKSKKVIAIQLTLRKDEWLYVMQDILQYKRDLYSLTKISTLMQSYETLADQWRVQVRLAFLSDGSMIGLMQSVGEGTDYAVLEKIAYSLGCALGDKIVRVQLAQDGAFNSEEEQTLSDWGSSYGMAYGHFCAKQMPNMVNKAQPVLMDYSMLCAFVDRALSVHSIGKRSSRERSKVSVIKEIRKKAKESKTAGSGFESALMGLGL